MPRRNDTRRRRLWLLIRVKSRHGKPLDVKREMVRDTLIDSINRGDYKYPDDWYVQIEWRNREFDPMKAGEFTDEMNKSSRSSIGWDEAVIKYLKGK